VTGLEDVANLLRSIDGRLAALATTQPAVEATPTFAPAPVHYLLGWGQILRAVGQPDAPFLRRLVGRLSKRDGSRGPIKTVPGGMPWAVRNEFVLWWNAWRERHEEGRQRCQRQQREAEERQSEVEHGQHPWGREDTAVPAIGGGIRKRKGQAA
jgi:hypothetical protein